MKTRSISDSMMKAFLGGELAPLLGAVKRDDTLCLELRGKSVNIYYRGGSLFRIDATAKGYKLTFNPKYFNSIPAVEKPVVLDACPSVSYAVDCLPMYKQCMDWYMHEHPGYENEFRQVIARENNNHGRISNGTDYFIADTEYVDGRSRFDMVAVKWLSEGSVRKDTGKASLALIELKYGDGAVKGIAGAEKHLEDLEAFFIDTEKVKALCEDMSKVFRQKCELGLVDGIKESKYNVTIDPENPEVIFIFANHDPASKRLSSESMNPGTCPFPVLVANASYMGYCLYAQNMEPLGRNLK